MKLSRLRRGEWIAAIGAVGLFLTLFFGWFDVNLEGAFFGGFKRGFTAYAPLTEAHTGGWSTLGWFLVALLVLAMAGAVAMGVLTASARLGIAVASTVLTAFFGSVAFLVVLIRVITKPDLGAGLPNSAVTIEPAAYIGLAFAFAIALGGWLAIKDERTDAPESAYTPPAPRPAPPAAL